jgi:predicted nucleotidyltransferase
MSCLADLPVDYVIDVNRREVTLEVTDFDSALIADYVVGSLMQLHGIHACRDDAAVDGHGLVPPAPYTLLVELAGTLFRAQVVRLFAQSGADPKYAVTLENPVQERRRRCVETASEVLEFMHSNGFDAMVIGSVAKGAFHACTDVDVLVTGQDEGAERAVRSLLDSRTWRALLDLYLGHWFVDDFAAKRRIEPHLVWSTRLKRPVRGDEVEPGEV